VIDLIELCKPDVIFISATPPTAKTHARSIVRRLRRQFPEMPLLVGLWNAQGDLNKAKERIGGGKSTRVVPTLADGQEQIRLILVASYEPPVSDAPGQTRCEPLISGHGNSRKPSPGLKNEKNTLGARRPGRVDAILAIERLHRLHSFQMGRSG
jgi:hypothetical protein